MDTKIEVLVTSSSSRMKITTSHMMHMAIAKLLQTISTNGDKMFASKPGWTVRNGKKTKKAALMLSEHNNQMQKAVKTIKKMQHLSKAEAHYLHR